MGFFKTLSRRKPNDDELIAQGEESKLARVLGLPDLTLLGVGATLGVGVYVLAGSVAKNQAGPAVIISFLAAAIASFFSGICYAEFAARVPKAGSAYIYSYVTVGEFIAYVIGWNLILEYCIGTASVAKAMSDQLDALLGNINRNAMLEVLPIHVSFMAPYPDFVAAGIVFLLSILLAWGVKESSIANNVFTLVNLFVVALMMVAGSFKVDFSNWNIPKANIPADKNGGEGGFAPWGLSGIMAGAAKCFFGFIGFDCIATCGEEAKKPQRNIPLSIVLSLIVIFICNFGIACVLTLMWPYYDQDPEAPFPYVFEKVGWPIMKYIVTIGSLFALSTSMLGAMFPLPRVLYAMASDGLLYEFFSHIHPVTKTPVLATLVSGVLSGIMAALFKLDQLIDMMSIGTLLAYTIVSICVMILRYRDPNPTVFEHPSAQKRINGIQNGTTAPLENKPVAQKTILCLSTLFNLSGSKYVTSTTEYVAEKASVAFTIMTGIICFLLTKGEDSLIDGPIWIKLLLTFELILYIAIYTVISRQPQVLPDTVFRVPLVPFLPCLSIFLNFYLMMKLDLATWVRFFVWLGVGTFIYLTYSLKNSKEGIRQRMKEVSERKAFAAMKMADVSQGIKNENFVSSKENVAEYS
uniref:High affinity cationic amino acid transporter 1 n=1 Tax=Cacopsylla melanoneura TaxID=428564 RepID=A0A8D8ZXD8_9HEMI